MEDRELSVAPASHGFADTRVLPSVEASDHATDSVTETAVLPAALATETTQVVPPVTSPTPATDSVSPAPRPRKRKGKRTAVLAAVAVAVLALAGFGGKFAWDATAVKRKCALQSADMAAIVPWSVASVRVSDGPNGHPFVNCEYLSRGPTAMYQDRISVYQDATEEGQTPGRPERCLNGGYWQGRGYTCVNFYTGGGIGGKPQRAVSAKGLRLNGPTSFSGEVWCVEDGPAESPTRELQERCFTELTKVMSALTDKLEVPPDATIPQGDLSLDAALSAAGLDMAPAEESQPTEDPVVSEPVPSETPSEPEPEPSDEPSPDPTTEAGDISGIALFDHFDVSVQGAEPRTDGTTLVHIGVCVTSLTDDATNGTVRISWDPWSATTSSGRKVKPASGKNVPDPFPRETRLAESKCAEGNLLFKADDIASVSYKNGQGDSATFP